MILEKHVTSVNLPFNIHLFFAKQLIKTILNKIRLTFYSHATVERTTNERMYAQHFTYRKVFVVVCALLSLELKKNSL